MKINAIGGYSEVGKNMTLLENKEDAFIFDEGFYLPAIVEMQEKEKGIYTEERLRRIEAIPNDKIIDEKAYKVKAQIISHAHLDHVGAVPFISNKYNASIYGTPFTNAILDSLASDSNIFLRNRIKTIQPNSSFDITGKKENYKIEFINITHSTPQTSIIALKSKEGIYMYANDFKIDNDPILGLKPNYQKLKELSKEGIKALIIDSLYSGTERKTPSERIARNLLEEVLFGIGKENSAIFVTTFSSHIARLKSIVEFGERLGRDIVFLGRSLEKYCKAAKEIGIAPFLRKVRICSYRKQIERELLKIERKRNNYLVVCTGHQGEPGSILERLSRGEISFNFKQDDNIIFSSSVIPTEINKNNFSKMEERLKKKKVRIFKDVHVSGHASREDLRDMIKLLNPENIIPSHGDSTKTSPMVELAEEMGYKNKKNIHQLKNEDSVEL
ncbi:MAG: MBL fold metallo-hydrolase RNA specificity domain-containing protein [Candidatus Pacearchaeota archaeon]